MPSSVQKEDSGSIRFHFDDVDLIFDFNKGTDYHIKLEDFKKLIEGISYKQTPTPEGALDEGAVKV